MRRFVISLLTLPAVKLQDSYQQPQQKQNQDLLNDPWSEENARNWFFGGNNNKRRHFTSDQHQLPSVGDYSDMNQFSSNSDIPEVGGDIEYKDYKPSWQTQYKIKQTVNIQNIQQNPSSHQKQQLLPELSYNQRVENGAFESFPAVLLPSSVPSSGSLEKPQQNLSSNNDGLGSRQRSKNVLDETGGGGSEGSRLAQDDQQDVFVGSDAGYISDLLARQNYWDSSFGNWPTHTVNPSNINILEEPETLPGQLCPSSWKYFSGSCYLLRNQELFPGELVTTLYKASWYTAKATCNALGAFLTEIDSEEEQNFVEDIKKKNHVALLWTGAIDFSQNGYWTWSQSKKPVQFYQKWSRPAPAWRRSVLGPVGRGNCMALRRDGKWDSFRCPNKFPYLCERNSSVSLITSTTTPSTTSSSSTTTAATTVTDPGQQQCYSMTIDSMSWVKLSSKLLSHPPEGRCWVRIVFSTFSNGLVLRKFDWNHESISLAIVGGEIVLKMATGSSQDISVSSSLLVTDGLEHTAVLSFGVGFISLQVDDDHVKTGENYQQPGLAHDANVFLGGQPGGEFSGFSGCVESFQVFVSHTKFSAPDWSSALMVDFSKKTSLTILYGDYQCGVCSMRDLEEISDDDDSDDDTWGPVDELPRPMTTWSSPFKEPGEDIIIDGGESNRGYPESSYTRVVDESWIVHSKPITVLDINPTTTTSTTTSTTSTTTSSTTVTTTTTKVVVKQKITSKPETTKKILMSTALQYVRRPCTNHQLSLDGSGWLELSRKLMPQKENYKIEIILRFNSLQANSLILWQGDYRRQQYFAIALANGYLEFRFNLGTDPAVLRSPSVVNDGIEHEIVITREESRGSVQVDGGITVPGITEGGRLDVKKSHIYLGGAPPHSPYLPPEATLYKTPFRGCIHSLQIWNNKIKDVGSGSPRFGGEIDFTSEKYVYDVVNINCVEQC